MYAFKCGETPGTRKQLVCCPELKSVENCGKLTYADNIVGGDETDLDEFPWTVRLFFERNDKGGFKCGGSLINDRYVMTAAHCLNPNSGWNLKFVRLGDWDDDTDPDCMVDYSEITHCNDKYQDFEISKVIIHDEYLTGKNNHNDIALLKLATPVRYSHSIAPVCIPTAEMDSGLNVTRQQFDVTGWGVTENRVPSKRKLKVRLPGQDMNQCAKAYRKRLDFFIDSQLCVGGDRRKDSCRGDSGGPLMMVAENRWQLMGIVSYGSVHCGLGGVPGIYTRVGSFLQWAAAKIELEERNH